MRDDSGAHPPVTSANASSGIPVLGSSNADTKAPK